MLIGCGERPVVEVPPSHPASLDAAEAPPTTVSTTLALPQPSDAPGGEVPRRQIDEPNGSNPTSPQLQPSGTGAGEQTTSTDWTCRMHPEVIKTQPGLCPICHMKLIPKQQEASKP
jgi:hypothetical protein